MQLDTVREGMTLLDEFFGETALTRIDFDRAKDDSFSIYITPCRLESKACLNEEEAIGMAPAGSCWKVAEGWRSFFGHRLRTASGFRFIVGLKGVVPHEQRGAYPVLRAYTFLEDRRPLQGMRELARRLYEGPPLVGACRGVIRARSQTPGDHKEVEGKIVEIAARCYDDQPGLLFRTLILCASRLPRKYRGSYLVATVPVIQRAFSPGDRSWCLLHRRMW